MFLTVRFAPARGPAYGGLSAKSAASGASRGRGRGRTFRVNEKYQKVTQGTTFLENPPSLRGYFVALRPVDYWSIVRALGRCRSLLLRTVLSRDVIAASRQRPSRQPTGLPGCLAALGTKVWQGGCEFEECTVRTCAPCRQYPFERAAAGLLQVPDRQKKDRQFGGFA